MPIETREVLAGAYLTGGLAERPMLTHAVVIDQDGRLVRTICRRVQLDSIADGNSGVDRGSEPTCLVCRRALKKLDWKPRAASLAAPQETQ